MNPAFWKSIPADIHCWLRVCLLMIKSSLSEDSVTESSVSAFHHVGGDIFEQLRFIVWESDQQIDEQPFSPERDDFIISCPE